MTMNPTPIRPIYDMPGHKHYGPVRRTWMMLEQMFADRGGVRPVEIAIEDFRTMQGHAQRDGWDAHMAWLLDAGQTEPQAQRVVVQQMLVAEEWVR